MSRLKKAISLAKSGQADRAAELLRELVQENHEDIYAWLWLAECTTDTGEARYAAKQVLSLRPTNSRALLILEELGEEDGTRFIPVWMRPKRKREDNRISRMSPRSKLLLFGGIITGIIALGLGFAYLTDFPNEAVSEAAVAEDIASVKSDDASITESEDFSATSGDDDAVSKIEPVPVPVRTDNDELDPEALTIQWIQDVVSGEEEADISFSCDDDSRSGLQRTLEPFLERLVEYGVRTALRTLQLEAVFDVIEVIDAGAEYEVDGRLIVDVLGQRIESPEFSTIIRFVSEQGKWVVCEVTGS
ncbi:MAG: tetratricopeptide repeat protein [Chloroflexi bacterium]|nr:tetratricopeptide repeat protein [Chloroflexota bacterium]